MLYCLTVKNTLTFVWECIYLFDDKVTRFGAGGWVGDGGLVIQKEGIIMS